ncbi:MAG TPA: hemolysin family protein, partial [Blastocatellia bacterium]|nr:hemolysin family protein [Blastocatellia bacterium]
MTAIGIEALIVILLVIFNGVLAMSELAIVSARKVRLQQRAERGDKGSGMALELANNPGQFLSTVQIGITLVGIMAGAFGGATIAEQIAAYIDDVPALARYSEAIGVGIVVLAITYLSLVLGELVPKRLALNRAEEIASAMARPMRILSVIASPAVRLLSFSTDLVLKVFGVKPSTEPPITEDEVKMLIEMGTEAGVFEKAEHEMVKNIFRFGDRRVNSLMTPRHEVVWLDSSDSIDGIRKKIIESGHSRFPVCKDSLDNVLGMVRAKDMLAAALTGQEIDFQAHLRRPVFVPEGMRALKALEFFKQSGTHGLLVVDEYGSTQGLVTHHDILEAIVGDIAIAGEPGESWAIKRDDGSWLLDGMLSTDDLKEVLGIKRLPGEDTGVFHTLAGFMMNHMARVPSVGEYFEWGGLR